MDLATLKFQAASKDFNQPGFAEVLALVYESVPDSARELKSILCSMAVRHASALVVDESFMEVAAQLPAFAREILPSLVVDYESKLEEKQGKIRGLISELDILRNDLHHTQDHVRSAEEEAKNRRKQVNNAKRCRHCGKENNLFYERDLLDQYSLRCVCRTRY